VTRKPGRRSRCRHRRLVASSPCTSIWNFRALIAAVHVCSSRCRLPTSRRVRWSHATPVRSSKLRSQRRGA
jgi:hypothetical protein